jgi:hypothetical protein
MAKILDRLPIATTDGEVRVRGEPVRVKAYEVIVWVSVSPTFFVDWHPSTPAFPAILDTAHTHNFSIQEEHLIRWAGLRPEALRQLGHIRQSGQRVPIYAANVWIHRNRRGRRDLRLDPPPYCLELSRGIAISPRAVRYPRLPPLGLRALMVNDLHLTIDGAREYAYLRTARRWWPF